MKKGCFEKQAFSWKQSILRHSSALSVFILDGLDL
jgi:hypothetical protein